MKKVLLILMILTTIFTIVACTSQEEHKHTVTGELVVVKEATCAEVGVAHTFCTECGQIVSTIAIPKTNEHTEVVVPAVESTCAEKGLTEGKKCSVCDKVLVAQQEAPLKAHTEEIIPAIDATCTSTGLSEGKKCSVCGDTLIAPQETPIIAHTYDDKYDETCNECGFVRDAECAHRETETVKGYEATCTSTGLTDGSKCKKCGEIIVSQTVISFKEHTEAVDEAVDATCTTIGLTEGKHCSACNTVLVEQKVIDAKGHDFGEWVTVTEPSVSKEGLKERVCFCGEKEIEVIAKLVSSEGLEFTLNSDGQSYSVKGIGTCTGTDVIIPNTYDDLPVTSIGYGAFWDCKFLTSVTFGDSVTSIGNRAFCNCTSLTSIEIPDSVTEIGWDAFRNCTSLTSIEIPESVTYIGSSAFGNCTSLKDVYYMGDVEGWLGISFANGDDSNPMCNGANLYFGGELVTKVVIPDSVTSIGEYTFNGCTSLTSVVIGDSVTSIDDVAFLYCRSLTSIVIGDSVTSIGNAAFEGCRSLIEVINKSSLNIIAGSSGYGDVCVYAKHIISDESQSYLKYVDDYIFYDDGTDIYFVKYIGSDTEITLPDYDGGKEYSIYGCAFDYNDRITSVIIPDSVTSIGGIAFYNCTSLTSIEIPDSVTSIGNSAFACCESLTSINFNGTIEQWNAIIKGDNWNTNTDSYTVYCTDGEIAKYGTVTYYEVASEGLEFALNDDGVSYSVIGIGTWTDSVLVIPDTYNGLPVTSIGDKAFYDCDFLTDVTILNNITNIGDKLFYDCDSLINITLPNSIDRIGERMFYSCNKLMDITIPDSVTSIEESAFYSCYGFRNITIPSSVLNIGSSAFYNCYKMTDIVISDGVLSIGDYAFGYCDALVNVSLGKSITTIGESAFSSCMNLESIYIPEGISSVGSYAFSGCSKLSNVTIIGNGSANIGSNAFKGLKNLTNVVIGEGVETIGISAFSDCTSLKDITISNGVKNISNNAFYNCAGLKTVTIGTDVTSIGSYAFSGCTALEEINFNATAMNDLNSSNSAFREAGQYSSGITVYIGANVTRIPAYLFESQVYQSYYPRISSIIFEEGSVCQSIGNFAFYGCAQLWRITIPKSVTQIGRSVFYGCRNLASITFEDTSNWYRSQYSPTDDGILTSVSSFSSNATYFTSTYYNYYWYKK